MGIVAIFGKISNLFLNLYGRQPILAASRSKLNHKMLEDTQFIDDKRPIRSEKASELNKIV